MAARNRLTGSNRAKQQARNRRQAMPHRGIPRMAASTPQLLRRQFGAVGERLELDPDDAGVDLAGRGEAGEAAIGAGGDVLAPDRLREAADPLGDQFGMLDDVRGMG